jgi:diguanylate cyclase (GGDEF)-like protein
MESEGQAARRLWAAASGAVTGLGVWGTHFVAMLGYRPGFEVSFDGFTTAFSLVIAVCGFIATSQILISGFSIARRTLCAVLATSSLSLMHFYGQGSLKASALMQYDAGYVAAAVLVCGLFFGLTYSLGVSREKKWRSILGVVFTLLAVACVHFIGTAAMTVFPLRGLEEVSWALSPGDLTIWIMAGVVLILCAALVAAGFDSVVSKLRTQENRRISMLADSASEGIVIANSRGLCVEVNQAAEKLLGAARSYLLGQDALPLVGLTGQAAAGAGFIETSITDTDGLIIPVEVRMSQLVDEDEGFTVFAISDLRERMRREAEIRTLAFNDQLSGLANREAFQRTLTRSFASDTGHHSALVLLDLDEFKDVNDQYGHEAGDAVIVETARRLQAILPEGGLAARLGGDEFAVLTGPSLGVADVEKFATDCVEALSESLAHDGITIRCSASAGVCMIDEAVREVGDLMKSADRALYAAKSEGRRRARLYDEELHQRFEARREIEAALVQAVAREEFVLHYQPKVVAGTREVLGYEALIRWNRPGHGMVMPNDFIDIAEQSMLVNEIGRWCIREACREASTWQGDLTISVNLSARQFLDPRLYADVRDALRRSGLPPARLELEVTETAIIHNVQLAADLLEKFKKLGVKIALDDFGTGYSSMRFVQQLPFDRIKIDKSFVLAMENDTKSLAIVDAILRLGNSLSIPVVAEGVETESQALKLLQANCQEFQGFLISRPGPLDGILRVPDIEDQKASKGAA